LILIHAPTLLLALLLAPTQPLTLLHTPLLFLMLLPAPMLPRT
jgi:hypothetical protein